MIYHRADCGGGYEIKGIYKQKEGKHYIVDTSDTLWQEIDPSTLKRAYPSKGEAQFKADKFAIEKLKEGYSIRSEVYNCEAINKQMPFYRIYFQWGEDEVKSKEFHFVTKEGWE